MAKRNFFIPIVSLVIFSVIVISISNAYLNNKLFKSIKKQILAGAYVIIKKEDN